MREIEVKKLVHKQQPKAYFEHSMDAKYLLRWLKVNK